MEVAKGYSIAYKGLKNGAHNFDFKVDEALFEAFGSPEIRGGACDVEVQLDRSETQLMLDVAICGHVVVECDRCLEDCPMPIDFEGRLVVKFSNEVSDYDGEILWLPPSADEVDLSQYIYESILLSLPYQRVHPEGGCDPEMLARFGILSTQEFEAIEAHDEQEEPKGAEWEKLAALKRQLEEAKPERSPKKK